MRRPPFNSLVLGLSLWGCSDPVDPSADGRVAVSTATSGDDPDPDGFQLRIDGSKSLALLPSGTAELDLSPGRHTLQLLGVAEHCSVAPGTSVEVDITAGRTAPVAFQVSCPGTRILVTVTTTGPYPDQDGYQLTIDGADALALNPTETAHVNVTPGRHTLELVGIAEQCAVTPGTVLELDIARGSTTPVAYVVDCPLTGARITITTTGQEIDQDGYTVAVDGEEIGVISANNTMLIRLDPGSRTITLSGVAPNCTIDGPVSQTVTIVTAEVAAIEFVVGCTAPPAPPPATGVLAFSTLPGSNLAVVNADGSNYRELTTHGADQYDLGAAWSPGGDRIAFWREIHEPGNPGGIYLINPDGTDLVRLTPASLLDLEPAWSPDGQRIAFTNLKQGVYTHAAYQIYVMNADGSHRVPITSEPGGASSPTWSPDGKKIAFQGFGTGASQTFHLYVMDADGSNVSTLTTGTEQNPEPAWSPNGSQIVFSSGDALVLIDADGTNRSQLTSPPPGTWSYHDSEPAWSPDGERIIFRRRYDCDPFDESGGPPCVPDELRSLKLSEPSVSSLVTHGWQPSWGPAAPQQPPPPTTSGFVWGQVLEASGACIRGAMVEIVEGPGMGRKSGQPDNCSAWDYDGFWFNDLPLGATVTLRATASGYQPEQRDVVAFSSGGPVQFVLEPK